MSDETPPTLPDGKDKAKVARPRQPLWLDYKPWGDRRFSPTNRVILRIVCVGVILGAMIFGAVIYWVATVGLDARHSVGDTQDYIAKAREQRLEQNQQFQNQIARNEQQTRDLACSTAAFIDRPGSSPEAKRYAAFLRARYSCTGYVPQMPVLPSSTARSGGTGSASVPGGAAPTTGPTSSRAARPRGSAFAARPTSTNAQPQTRTTRTVVRPQPGPTVTSTRVTTAPAPPSPTHLICLLTICL